LQKPAPGGLRFEKPAPVGLFYFYNHCMTSFGSHYKGRLEDQRMLTGQGRYVSDWMLPNQAAGHFLRSDRPHAKILSIDASAALAMPGVIAVITGKELADAGLKPIPVAAPFKWTDGSDH
jgi:carbon-monoxide dehydrogenase large subunit